MSFLKASLRPIASVRPLSAARPLVAPVAAIQFRPFHVNNIVGAKAQKGASGKKKKKEEFELPKDLTMDKIAADWNKWQHADKRDITLPYTVGQEPDWLKEILATADKNGILQWNPRKVKEVWELDPYVHGMKYTNQRLRKEEILIDNRMRAISKFKWVKSARPRSARQPRRVAP